MATSWKKAQVNEKSFWRSIYLSDNKNFYPKTNKKEDFLISTSGVLKNHNIDFVNLKNKILVDLGCGPYGEIMGIKILEKINQIYLKKIIGIDPLMDFYKKEIGLIKETENLKLINAKGEEIPLEAESVDVVISSNAIDHCEAPEVTISEVKRILKKNGIFYINVHVLNSKFSFLSKILKYFDKNHPHHFTESKLEYLLKKQFKNVKKNYSTNIFSNEKMSFFKILFKKNNENFFKGFKRAITNYLLYVTYYTCSK
jgi:ubiquinone/menaquinone biosynthesis C-methylase UbiE